MSDSDDELMSALGFTGFGGASKRVPVGAVADVKKKRVEEDMDIKADVVVKLPSKSVGTSLIGSYGDSDSEASSDSGFEQEDTERIDEKATISSTVADAAPITSATNVVQTQQPSAQFEVDWDDEEDYSDTGDAKHNGSTPSAAAMSLSALSACHSYNTGMQSAVTYLSSLGEGFLACSRDCTQSRYVYRGLNSSFSSEKRLEVQAGYPVLRAEISADESQAQVVTASNRPVLVNTDTLQTLKTCKAGYIYVSDVKQLKGHKGGCLDAKWHPTRIGEFITCGSDGCAKIWNVSSCEEGCISTIKPRFNLNRRGHDFGAVQQEQVTSCCYKKDGSLVALACDDHVEVFACHSKATYVNVEQSFEVPFLIHQVAFHESLIIVRGKGRAGNICAYDQKAKKIIFTTTGLPNDKDGDMVIKESLLYVTCSFVEQTSNAKKEKSGATNFDATTNDNMKKAALAMMGVTGVKSEELSTTSTTNTIFEAEEVHEQTVQAQEGQGSIAVQQLPSFEQIDVLLADEPVQCVMLTSNYDVIAGTASGRLNVWTAPNSSLAKQLQTKPKMQKQAANVYFDLNSAVADPTGKLTLHGVQEKPKRKDQRIGAVPSTKTTGTVNNTSIQHQYLKQFLPGHKK